MQESPGSQRPWLVAAAVLGIGVVGCASQPEPLPIPTPSLVMLAPTSVDQLFAEPLQSGAPIVGEMIGQVLSEQAVHVAAPRLPEFYELWRVAAQEALRAGDSDADAQAPSRDVAVRALLDLLRARGERFDALLVPYLTVRLGTGTAPWVRWDGVARRLPVQPAFSDAALFGMRPGIRIPCTSLGVIAYGSRGERLFERIGGLEVAKELAAGDHGRGRRLGERGDLFRDERALRNGVQMALRPLLRS